MSRCNYWDCGWCYAPDIVETNAEKSSACTNPSECPYLKTIMKNIPNPRFYNHENVAPDSSSERPKKFKPQPTGPRLIEESFLPTKKDKLKMNWRIKKFYHAENNKIYYIIQKKNFFGFWYDHNFNYCYFTSYKQANAVLFRQLNPEHTKIEYFEPDFDHLEIDECLPPPKNP
jgi:hypothetical protein